MNKIEKKTISHFILLLFFLILSSLINAQTAVAPSGSGASGDPYLIVNLNNLYWVTQNPSSWTSYFKQTADIDASSTSSWGGGAGFTPIGSNTNKFNGSYDGGNHTISNLYINRSTEEYVGLFGHTLNSDLKNIGLVNINVHAKGIVGALVGRTQGTNITNCYSTGSVTGDYYYVGGLVGDNALGDINTSYSTCTVIGQNQFTGGLVGANNSSDIYNSYATGSVQGEIRVGGFAGANFSGTINNSYSTGSVTGTGSVGGLIGVVSGSTTNNSFWDQQTSGQSYSADGTGKTTAEMKTAITFLGVGWDNNIWNMGDGTNNGYPYLDFQNTSGTTLVASAAPSGGGTSGNPYFIASLNNLYWVMQTPSSWDSYFKQIADIDASSTSSWNGGAGFIPIGNGATKFTGTYDGDGHTISKLFINNNLLYLGMFGYANSGVVIKNIGLINVNITGTGNVGSLAGLVEAGTISNCFSTGSLTKSPSGVNPIGGLIAQIASSTINNSYTRCSLSGGNSGNPIYAGGFVGSLTNVNMDNCFSTGPVNVSSIVGNAGFIKSESGSTITNSFWDTQTSGQSFSDGGIGKTTAEMKTPSTFINAGWDFELEVLNGTNDYWDMDVTNASVNNGYPFLSWQNGSSIALTPFDVAIDLGSINISSGGRREVSNNTSSSSNLYSASLGKDIYYKFSIIDNLGDPGKIGLTAKTLNAAFNTVLYLLDASGNQIAVNNGSGNDSEIQDFTKTLAAGTYYIVVDGADASQMGTFDLYLGVGNVAEAAFALTPQNGCSVPHIVFFTDQSYKPETWEWTFGDGGTSTAQNPIHTYTSTGNFIVTLIVQDTMSLSTSSYKDTVFVSIPNTDFTANTTFGCGPLVVDFTDASTNITSWDWDFGDGETSTEQNPTHTYDKPGVYTVTLTGTSSNGCQDTKTATNYIQVIGPDVNFGIASTSGEGPITVNFADSTTANAPITSWYWVFGDGGNSNLQNPTHVYTTAGIYDVSLTVSDLDGCTRVLTKTNIVNTGPAVTINQASGQQDPTNSSTINFTAVFSEAVIGFTSSDVTTGGTAGATTATVTEIVPNDSTTFNVAITGMTNDGIVTATIAAGVAKDTAGINNWKATSIDDTVTYDTTVPTITIGQPSKLITNNEPVSYALTYNGATTVNLSVSDIILNTTKSANGTITVENGTTTTPTIIIKDIRGIGTIGISIKPGTSSDLVGNLDLGAGPSAVFTLNSSPIFENISDTTMNEDDTLYLSLNISDPDGNKLQLTTQSSQSEVLTDIDKDTLRIIPYKNWNGEATITIKADDGNTITQKQFALTVLPVNDRPSIDIINNIEINEDSSVSVAFRAHDVDGDKLALSGKSNNTNVTVSIIEGTNKVELTPATDWFGTAVITLFADDGNLVGQRSFPLIVNPINDAPIIENISDQQLMGTMPYEIDLKASDVDNDSLTFSAISNNDSISTTIFENRLTITPLDNIKMNGLIEVFVTDGIDSAMTSFNVKVIQENLPPVISSIDTQIMNEDETLKISYTDLYPYISDPNDPDSTLTISFNYSGNHFVLNTLADTAISITPKENWNGKDSIRINVSDTSLTTSATIIINVLPVNDIPVFSNVPDTIKIESDKGTILQVFDLISDVETPDTALTISFNISTDSIQYNYSKETGLLELFAITGYSGNASLNIKAVDTDSASNQTSLIIKVERTITDIAQMNEIPKHYSLAQNYPNPFNPSTNIKFTIPQRGYVSLKVYDILGKEVAQLVNKELNPGSYTVQFDASDANYGLASGIYLYRLESKQFHRTKKFILVK